MPAPPTVSPRVLSPVSPSFAPLPSPPYYAVIFASQRRGGDNGYGAMAEKMTVLAQTQPGYIGVESCRDADGFGLTVSYWQDRQAVMNWKQVAAHLLAQNLGKSKWYNHYTLRISKVERAYGGPEGR